MDIQFSYNEKTYRVLMADPLDPPVSILLPTGEVLMAEWSETLPPTVVTLHMKAQYPGIRLEDVARCTKSAIAEEVEQA